jgi:flavin reductase
MAAPEGDFRAAIRLSLVESAAATILCRVEQAAEFGNHMVVTGLVECVVLSGGQTPVHGDGRYGQVEFHD